MTHVIDQACIGEMDGSCVDVCPVDCIYEGLEKRYINANECIDCGACVTACPVSAIKGPSDGIDAVWAEDNKAFFALPLPTRDLALGDPGGAMSVGIVGVDTPRVTAIVESGT